jgi:hypothetical protein
MGGGDRQGGARAGNFGDINNRGGQGGNGGPINGTAWQGGPRTIDGIMNSARDPNSGQQMSRADAEQTYNDLVRDLGRLRGQLGNDKDLAREYQQLMGEVQQIDPKQWGAHQQMQDVIEGQLRSAIDEVELLLRRKLAANDGSVRSVNPRNTPPGYSNAVAEYYKRLSKQ